MYYFVRIETNVGPIHFALCSEPATLVLHVEQEGRRRGVFYDADSVYVEPLDGREYARLTGDMP